MKDEEMAEEYAEKHSFRVPYDGSNKFYDDTDFKASKDGFLAGLKAGRPRWHDLWKDPNDLPQQHTRILLKIDCKRMGYKVCCGEMYYDNYDRISWSNDLKLVAKPCAWKESE